MWLKKKSIQIQSYYCSGVKAAVLNWTIESMACPNTAAEALTTPRYAPLDRTLVCPLNEREACFDAVIPTTPAYFIQVDVFETLLIV